ncbi:hypothetical protein E2C01_048344 [Portunus trituberculatus]|uniref:Uncharacterized protein n=1 Tax=Portunus trituberculatus TaxID=210409 RepID=A0A5B7GBB3_PORTR|nr:hypothetical protein [Portunus trituberculatus]
MQTKTFITWTQHDTSPRHTYRLVIQLAEVQLAVTAPRPTRPRTPDPVTKDTKRLETCCP